MASGNNRVYCSFCHKELRKAPSDIKRSKTGRFYCSLKHRAAYALRELNKKKQIEEMKNEKLLDICPKCSTKLVHDEDRFGKIFYCVKCGFRGYGRYVDKWLDDDTRV